MEKNEKQRYVDRAADILADLIKKNRSRLSPPRVEAERLKEELKNVGKLDQTFRENSRKLIQMIQNHRLKRKK